MKRLGYLIHLSDWSELEIDTQCLKHIFDLEFNKAVLVDVWDRHDFDEGGIP